MFFHFPEVVSAAWKMLLSGVFKALPGLSVGLQVTHAVLKCAMEAVQWGDKTMVYHGLGPLYSSYFIHRE